MIAKRTRACDFGFHARNVNRAQKTETPKVNGNATPPPRSAPFISFLVPSSHLGLKKLPKFDILEGMLILEVQESLEIHQLSPGGICGFSSSSSYNGKVQAVNSNTGCTCRTEFKDASQSGIKSLLNFISSLNVNLYAEQVITWIKGTPPRA